jgi:hypothetical protein
MPELEVVIDVPVFDQTCMDIVMHKQYIFPRAMMNASITNKSESEKKEVNDDSTLDILKDSSVDYLGRIVYIYPETAITPISDLSGAGGSLKANLTFSAIGNSATNVTLMYKKSTDTTFSTVATTGTTGVYIVSPLNATSTSAEVLGLTAGTTYNFKITYVIDGVTYESNVDTEKATA